MKKIIYLFAAFFIMASTQSCKRVAGEDGDLLNNLGANQGGLTGDRFLYQEVNSVDTVAQYNYNGTKMVEVFNKKSRTNITYNGELINKINFYKVVGPDSLVYTQYFSYDATAKYITTISEVGTTYLAYKATVPGAVEKYKAIHDLQYSADKLLMNITTRRGKEIPATAFVYTSYTKYAFTFDALKKNIIKVKRDAGPYIAGSFEPATQKLVFDYSEYDAKINPYTLVPYGYKISAMLDDASRYFWISDNNPEKIVITEELVPVPTEIRTTYTYDAQDYVLSGFGKNYDYRPF